MDGWMDEMPVRYTHTNLVARDWKRLAAFYERVFGCVPVPPERHHSGKWLERVTGIRGATIEGMHLRLPGHGEAGPTLEIFQYSAMPDRPASGPNTPGFAHIAFAVEDVAMTVRRVLEHGGSEVGELTVREVLGVGLLTFLFSHVASNQNVTQEGRCLK